jgi:hypothetical protein
MPTAFTVELKTKNIRRRLLQGWAYGEFDGSQVVRQMPTADAWEVILVSASNGVRSGSIRSKRILGRDGAVQLCSNAMVEGMVLALLEAEIFLPPST